MHFLFSAAVSICRAVSGIEKFVSEIEIEQRQLEEKRTQYLAEQKALQERQGAAPDGGSPMGLSLQPTLSPSAGMQNCPPQSLANAAAGNFQTNANKGFANVGSEQVSYELSKTIAMQGMIVPHPSQYGNQGVNPVSPAIQGSVYHQGMQLKQPALFNQSGPLEENMEMSSPDRRDALPGGMPLPASDNLPQTAGPATQQLAAGYRGAAIAGDLGEVQGLSELLPKTLTEPVVLAASLGGKLTPG